MKDKNAKLKLMPVKAGVALYPWCDRQEQLDAPFLILIGALDDWTPAERCRKFAHKNPTSGLELIVYPEAHHVFDLQQIDQMQLGHVLRYHKAGADDAKEFVRNFLQKYLRE